MFYKTIGDFLKIGEDQRVVLKAKEVKFISISGKTTTIHMNYNSIDLLMGKIGLSTILNKKMIPQGTYSKAIIVLENPKGVVENEGNQFNLDIPNSNELVIEFTHPIEFVNGLTTEITFNFDLKSLKENPGKDFTLDVNLQYQSSEINLPFQPGILISSLKKEINIITDKDGLPKTGISSLDELLVKYKCVGIKKIISETQNIDVAIAKEVGLDKVYVFVFQLSQDIIEAAFDFEKDPNIEQIVTDNYTESASEVVPNDPEAKKNYPYYYGKQVRHLNIINAYEGWSQSKGSEDIKIAVIDTGIDDNHPDLTGKIIQTPALFNTTCEISIPALSDNPTIPLTIPCLTREKTSKPHGSHHGTHVAGIIGALTDNGIGIAGINWKSKIISINIFQPGERPYTTDYAIGQGILQAVGEGAKVINMSLGGDKRLQCFSNRPSICILNINPIEQKAIQYANKKGVVLVASAGNDNKEINSFPNIGTYPASFAEVISVSALNYMGNKKAHFSNYGKVDISTPGEMIYSTILNDQFGYLSGTSMAAPMVSAFASLILSINPDMHPTMALETMCGVATKVPGMAQSEMGCGRINIGETFTNPKTNPALPSPKISMHPIYMGTCRPGYPSYCRYGDTYLFDPIDNYTRAITSSIWVHNFDIRGVPFMVEGGTPPYTWSAEYKSWEAEIPFQHDPHRCLYHNAKLLMIDDPKPRFNPTPSKILVDTCSGHQHQDTANINWTVDIRVTDIYGKSDVKRFGFYQ
ncbi:MAG: S8 family serine peptidase [Leptospiraceae bacterium]|nr:S8 family serine peptidase [Leptospiraceae bacterium]